jgi:hypothetical protein
MPKVKSASILTYNRKSKNFIEFLQQQEATQQGILLLRFLKDKRLKVAVDAAGIDVDKQRVSDILVQNLCTTLAEHKASGGQTKDRKAIITTLLAAVSGKRSLSVQHGIHAVRLAVDRTCPSGDLDGDIYLDRLVTTAARLIDVKPERLRKATRRVERTHLVRIIAFP